MPLADQANITIVSKHALHWILDPRVLLDLPIGVEVILFTGVRGII